MNLFVAFFNSVFTYPLFNLLMMLYFWLGDFGLSIVALTSVVSLLLLPLTLWRLRTARVMRRLEPQVAAIRQQYATDQSAQAIQALYREHNVHPISSSLLLLIQAPIYSGLYFAFNTVLHASSVAVINCIMYPFLVHFATLPNIDLMWFSILNASWHISLGIQDPTHLLPLLTGALTFVQMQMMQPASVTETRLALLHASQLMQLMLMLIPVVITIVFAWQFAAGLALYRFVSLLINMIVQYFTMGRGSMWPLASVGSAHGSLTPEQLMQPATPSRAKRQYRSSSSRRRGKKPGRGKK